MKTETAAHQDIDADVDIGGRRRTVVWLLLMAATTLSWTVGHSSLLDVRAASTGVIVVALVKVWLVGLEFMELRNAPMALRMAFKAWVLLVGAMLICIYLMRAPS